MTRPIDAATFNLPGSMTVQPDMPAGRITPDELLWVPWASAEGGRFKRSSLNREGIERAAAEIERLGKALDEARAKLFPYADDKEISGMSWGGFYLIGNDKSIKELRRLENVASQVAVWRQGFDEHMTRATARAEAAERSLAEAVKVLEPFAEIVGPQAELDDGYEGTDAIALTGIYGELFNLLETPLRVEHFRAARTFLSSLDKGKTNG